VNPYNTSRQLGDSIVNLLALSRQSSFNKMNVLVPSHPFSEFPRNHHDGHRNPGMLLEDPQPLAILTDFF
jgi:hypothetical protein